SLQNLGEIYVTMDQYMKAEPFYRESLEIQEKILKPDDPELMKAYVKMAEFYRVMGKRMDAERIEKKIAALKAKPASP
ncbi:MAG: tetratricopeptide repeat protein, partial [Kiritimatiellia bacterium]|nr:tetratricopeptide repeat protein [Kiritimatiellia bacterium]